MNHNKKIDVIIPAYNVPDSVLFRCLSSIACQNIVESIEVTIVDDASTNQNYSSVIDNFNSFLKINLLRCEKNGGSGVARQYGIDRTSNEYLCFVDADDTLNGTYALEVLKDALEKDDVNVVAKGWFKEEVKFPDKDTLSLLNHKENNAWVFGKVFRRAFLEKYNIRFHETSRANEDGGFYQIVEFCFNDNEHDVVVEEYVYNWHYNETSITAKSNCEYEFTDSMRGNFYGYVENMAYAVNKARELKLNPIRVNTYAMIFMIRIYVLWLQCNEFANEYSIGNLRWAKMYYDSTYKELESNVDNYDFKYYFGRIMQMAFTEERICVPSTTYEEFLNMLKK